MNKKTIESCARKAYEAPSVHVELLQAESYICAASQEGFPDETDYIFSTPALDSFGMGTLTF